jgi:4a-hydroxytetrahydrobiopterin dehydratase
MSTLSQKHCLDCQLGVKLSQKKIAEYKALISPLWEIRAQKLFRHYKFSDFKAAKIFVDKVSELAESEGHHPDITFSYTFVDIVLYTHKAKGLTEADFVLAAKIDGLG